MKKMMIAALALLVTGPALANTTVVTFDDYTGSPGTLSGGYVIQTGSNSLGAALPGNSTPYLSTTGTSYLLFNNIIGTVNSVSFDWGSNDLYNEFFILGDGGVTVFNQHGWGNGDHNSPADNGTFTHTFTAAEKLLGFTGFKFVSRDSNSIGQPAMEIDNATVISSVPEPASWALMVAGFAMVGYGSRSRHRAVAA